MLILKKIKPAYIYGFLSLCLLAVIILVSFHKTAPSPPSVLPSSTPQTHSFSGINNQDNSIKYSFTTTPPSLQNDLPWFTIVYPSAKEETSQIEQKFQVNNPQEINLTDFHKFNWTTATGYVTYNVNDHTLAYFNSTILHPSQSLDDISLTTLAIKFIETHINLPSEIQLSQNSKRYLQSNGTEAREVTDKNIADFMEIEYRFLINNHPLYTPPLEQLDLVIDINPDGIRELKVKVPPLFHKATNVPSYISQDKAQQLLMSGYGSILKVNSDAYGSEGGPLFAVDQMEINQVETGYVVANSTLSPAYIFIGSAPNQSDPTIKYNVEVAVPAKSNL